MHRTKPRRSSASDSPRRSLFNLLAVVVPALLATALSACGPDEKPVAFTGEAAHRYLVEQCRFGPRPPGTAAHDNTVRFISSHLKERGAEVTLQRFSRSDPYSDRSIMFTNIIGSFWTDRKKRVLLAAHFDTRPRADQEKEDSLKTRPIIGANDGASGVAVLLEIADLLAQKMPKGLGVDLVFFDGEDYGEEGDLEHYLLGSKYFAANLGGYRPACAILLDMVGADGAKFYQEGNSLAGATEFTTEIFRRAEALGLDAFTAEKGTFIYDDHIPLLLAGIPAVDLIGVPYPHWHTLGDTPDKCSTDTLREVGTLVADLLYNFSF